MSLPVWWVRGVYFYLFAFFFFLGGGGGCSDEFLIILETTRGELLCLQNRTLHRQPPVALHCFCFLGTEKKIICSWLMTTSTPAVCSWKEEHARPLCSEYKSAGNLDFLCYLCPIQCSDRKYVKCSFGLWVNFTKTCWENHEVKMERWNPYMPISHHNELLGSMQGNWGVNWGVISHCSSKHYFKITLLSIYAYAGSAINNTPCVKALYRTQGFNPLHTQEQAHRW